MLRSVLSSGGAVALLFAGYAHAQISVGGAPGANIGSTIGAGAQIGAPGALGESVTGSPITPSSPLPVNPSVVGSLTPSAAATISNDAATQAQAGATQPAVASSIGVNASASAPLTASAPNPVQVGALVRSQSGAQVGTIARLIPGADGYVSGVVLRTPSGTLRQAPLSALGLSGGMLVTTYSTAQINALPEAKTGP